MCRTVQDDKVLEVLEVLDWTVTERESTVELTKFTDWGQECLFEVQFDESISDMCQELKQLYEDFDCSYEAYLWLDSDGHGKNGAPYDMRDVYDDMVERKAIMQELYQHLSILD